MPLRPLAQPIDNPLFNLARGTATVTTPPPFSFENVTMRIFPLRANYLTLANLCNQYLNIAPEFAYFRPSMPFVMLTIVNYGKMGIDAGNLGWTSQNEVLFSIPLDWYVPGEDGQLTYNGSAQVAPFIFVDNEGSQVAGREVFGWPKVQGWFARGLDSWAENPRKHRKLLTVDSYLFEELYAGDRPEPRELIVIEEEPPLSFTITPPDASNPINPANSIPAAMQAWTKLLINGMPNLTRLPMDGYSTLDRERALPNLIQNAIGGMRSFVENTQANTINLKQFRDAEQPTNVCYQAITNAKMKITQFRRGGMLGDLALLRGEPNGGHRIHLHRYESQPIMETLGLIGSDEGYGHGGVAKLEPVMPFWCQLDLTYLAGENLAWRARDLEWRNDQFELIPEETRSESGVPKAPPAFNTTGSTGFQVATGPFHFPSATLRVLPLLADPAKLKALCDGYLNIDTDTGEQNDIARFEPWGDYVYLVVTSIDGMSSETNNIGLWGNRQVEFAIPIRWYDRPADGSADKPMSVGFFSPFLFSEGGIQTTTGREVNGWPTVASSIASPDNPWITGGGPVAEVTPLLELRTDVFPALGMGQESEWRTLIEITQGDSIPANATRDWDHVADTWGRRAKSHLSSLATNAKAHPDEFEAVRLMAIELLGNRAPFNQISLKQFRDAEEPYRACYQALVNCRTVIERVHDLREIEKPLHVRMQRYPTQPIVDTLGLAVKSRETNGEGVVEILQPSRPFYLRVDLRSELGENICWRAGSHRWNDSGKQRSGDTYLTDGKLKDVGPSLLEVLRREPEHLLKKVQDWRLSARDEERLDSETALKAVASSKVEPQSVIHAMLSTEVEHAGNPRWWQESRRRVELGKDDTDIDEVCVHRLPYFVMRRDSVGTAHHDLFPEDGCIDNLDARFELDDDRLERGNTGYWSPEPDFGPDQDPGDSR